MHGFGVNCILLFQCWQTRVHRICGHVSIYGFAWLNIKQLRVHVFVCTCFYV